MRKRLAIFVSGTGTILESLIESGLEIDLVLSDRTCSAIDRVKRLHHGVPSVVVHDDSRPFNRYDFTMKVVRALLAEEIDVVAMAGFMTVLDPVMFRFYGGLVLNTHPSLLPAFKGRHAVRDALARGVKITGCTVYVATEAVDEGEILAQRAVEVLDGDTIERLHKRIKEEERRLYPRVIRGFMNARFGL